MKKVLFPTDFSENSLNTIPYAAAFCNKIHAKLILFNAMLAPVIVGDAPCVTSTEVMTTHQKAIKEKLEYLAFKTRNQHNVIVDIKTKYGFPVDAISDFAESENIDIIILSAKGETNVLDDLFGNVTLNLFEKTEKPILSIPAEAEFEDVSKIVFATSNVYNDAVEVFNLLKLTEKFKPEVKLVHIKKGKGFEPETFEDYNNVEYLEIEGNESNRIEKLVSFLSENLVDIVCVKKYKLPFFQKLLKKSFTKGLFKHSKTPLFVFTGD